MIIGRVIGGLGIGVNTTTIPMFQSETCKPSLRGKLVSVQLTFLVFGFVLTNWMNFGFTYVPNNPVSWRFPLGFQSALAIGTVFLLPMLAESPRWLCLKDRQQEAEVVLSRLVAKPIDDPEVQDLLHVMVTTIARERADGQITWREVFHNGSQQTFRRIVLGAGTSFMQQIGGVNIVAYYLPVVLERSFGFSPRLSLILSACDSMQWMFWAAMAYFVIERVGRFKLMLFGAAGCSMCFAVTAAGLGVGGKVGNGVAVAFIFLYYFFYVSTPFSIPFLITDWTNTDRQGLSWLAIPFLYPSEINSNRSRNRGASIAMITNWVCVYLIVSITPVGKPSQSPYTCHHPSARLTKTPSSRHRNHRMALLRHLRRAEPLLDPGRLVLLRRDLRTFARRNRPCFRDQACPRGEDQLQGGCEAGEGRGWEPACAVR